MGCGRYEWQDCLRAMAEVEWEHERYFRERVLSHWLGKRLPLWPKPAPKSSIRERFEEEIGPTALASDTPLQPTGSAGA